MSVLRRAATIAAVAGVGVLGASGAVVARRSYRRLGATESESREALPGDGVVTHPDVHYTHAITIAAAPEDVWPWIAQLGVGRGGLYSYAWLEDVFGARSVEHVVPELQELLPGDPIKQFELAGREPLRVARVEPQGLLLLQRPGTSWVFVLRETDDGATRLIVRTRAALAGIARPFAFAIELGSLLMDRKMIREIRRRAEALAWSHLPVIEPADEEVAEAELVR
ncbi:MAG TPA: SRPBCC family protein [Candidatus Limnocylindria bacterium]